VIVDRGALLNADANLEALASETVKGVLNFILAAVE
jgi:hypothetical protein